MNGLVSADATPLVAALLQACFDLPLAWGEPSGHGQLKACPEDFVVNEELGFEPDGEGEHLFIEVEKRGLGTLEVQRWLADRFRLPLRKVSFSGMKDRQALTRQWFSLQLGLKAAAEQAAVAPDPALPPGAAARILRALPNRRKLQRGSHRRNHFRLCIRDFSGDRDALQQRLRSLQEHGVPNYFGPQRFGYGGSTLQQAWQQAQSGTLTAARSARSLQLSAARAFLFNRVLAARVADASWRSARDGELMQLAGTASLFAAAREDPHTLETRLDCGDVHPTGPLWGRGELPVSGAVARLEAGALAEWQSLCRMLENAGLNQERRALRMLPESLGLVFAGSDLMLEFALPRGCYATSLVRELLSTDPAPESNP